MCQIKHMVDEAESKTGVAILNLESLCLPTCPVSLLLAYVLRKDYVNFDIF